MENEIFYRELFGKRNQRRTLIKPIVDTDDDFDVERIMHSKIVEKGEDGSIYYEDSAESGVFFPQGIPIDDFISKLKKVDG
ncbi:MAG: hypothetical protein LBU27_06735 [Candidatus Peribacteria bacterium]|jgi:hypothetical protein|nr:hypothetical protein [Candidatus Peribacteria bacterium]